MTFTQIMKDIFTPKAKKAKDNASSGGAKRFLSKISGAFMLPVSIMAIAGLFLGIGAAVADHTSAKTFGSFLKSMGQPIFDAMPALFLVAVIIAFTDDIGTAVFSGLVAFLVFNAMQEPFISVEKDSDWMAAHPGSLVGPGGGTKDSTGTANVLWMIPETLQGKIFKVIGSNLGITSLNSSIFGGILIGFISVWAFNRFSHIELPSMISFFGGKRFVPLALIVMMIPTTFLFLLVWPWIGVGLAYFGEYSGKVQGLDSFLFGFAERSLVPFGLHHVFYAPLWWTAAGGDANQALADWTAKGNLLSTASQTEWGAFTKTGKTMGDAFMWVSVNSSFGSDISWTDATATKASHTLPTFEFFKEELGLNLGRFMQGKFAFMQLGLPAAGAAMIMAAPKENRKQAAAVIIPASATAFVTGVTEPIEFTFVFLAPELFWGFHALMAATSFLMMNLLGAHVGMTFSGGFIDTIIYGILPISKGTHFYWMYVIGLVLAPIYYFVFYYWIKFRNLDTPGRGGNTQLFTKADYKASKAAKSAKGLSSQGAAIVAAYGGWDNITKFANCATRLRYDIKDASKVDEKALKAAGAMGVTKVSDTHIQTIVGPVAEQLNGNISRNKGQDLKGASSAVASKTTAKKATKSSSSSTIIKSIGEGDAKELSTLKDGVFSEKMMGDGIVVAASKTAKTAKYYAPVSGKLVTVFPTKHAYGIQTDDGVELLLHIGIDTVNLKGKGFKSAVKQGQTVKAGDELVTVDLESVRKNAPSADAILIVTSGQKVTKKAKGKVTKTSTLFEVQ